MTRTQANICVGSTVVFWLSAWLPGSGVYFVAAWVAAALAATIIAFGIVNNHSAFRKWLASVLAVIGFVFLFSGGVYTFLVAAVGTSAEGYLAVYRVIGWAVLAMMLAGWFGITWLNSRRLVWGGCLIMVALATWSWVSAARMKLHVGAEGDTSAFCILVPDSLSEYVPITSLWDMRLPSFVSARTGPTGTTILDYHALLIGPDAAATIYNWSKRSMRFEPLSKQRNPYLPKTCIP